MTALRNVVLAELTVMPLGTTAPFTIGNVTRVNWKMYIVSRGGNRVMQGTSKQVVDLHSRILDNAGIPALGSTR